MEYSSTSLIETYLRTRKIPSTACSGCGLGINHKIVIQAISELGMMWPILSGDIHRVRRTSNICYMER